MGIVSCVIENASDVYRNLKKTDISLLYIVRNLLSGQKQEYKKVLKKYSKLHLDPILELTTLFKETTLI